MPRAKIEIDTKRVEELAARGLTIEQISDCMGIDPATLYRRRRVTPELQEAIKRGRARGIAYVTNKLLENVNAGNVTAQIFFLKCRAGWRETQGIDLISSDGSMSPASLPDMSALTQEEREALVRQAFGKGQRHDGEGGGELD